MKPPAPLLFVWLAATGCAPAVNNSQPFPPAAAPPVRAAAPPPVHAAAAPAKRVIIDPSLESALQVVKATTARGAEGYLKIQVDVENRSEAPRPFRYCIEWLDGDGAVLTMAGNGFLEWMLRGHETSSIAATAPTPAATDFRITFLGPAQ
jgi:hypothetical protein